MPPTRRHLTIACHPRPPLPSLPSHRSLQPPLARNLNPTRASRQAFDPNPSPATSPSLGTKAMLYAPVCTLSAVSGLLSRRAPKDVSCAGRNELHSHAMSCMVSYEGRAGRGPCLELLVQAHPVQLWLAWHIPPLPIIGLELLVQAHPVQLCGEGHLCMLPILPRRRLGRPAGTQRSPV